MNQISLIKWLLLLKASSIGRCVFIFYLYGFTSHTIYFVNTFSIHFHYQPYLDYWFKRRQLHDMYVFTVYIIYSYNPSNYVSFHVANGTSTYVIGEGSTNAFPYCHSLQFLHAPHCLVLVSSLTKLHIVVSHFCHHIVPFRIWRTQNRRMVVAIRQMVFVSWILFNMVL